MKISRNRYPRFFVSHRHLLLVIGVFISLVALGTLPLLSTAASSLPSGTLPTVSGSRVGAEALGSSRAVVNSPGLLRDYLRAGKTAGFNFALAETIETFAADCDTPKTAFVLGETVCAKTDGVDLGFPGGRWVHWIDDVLNIAHGGSGITDITANPQTFTYTPTSTGTWKATIAETGDISQTPATFTVADRVPVLATYAADCTTPKTTFNYSDTICAKVSGVDTAINRRIAWVDPSGYVRENQGSLFTPLATDPQSASFSLPGSATSGIDVVDPENVVVNTISLENRGAWSVRVLSNRGSIVLTAPFTLQDPVTPSADLSVIQGLSIGDESTGEPITYIVNVTNLGPNDAASVELTNPTLLNATFQSAVQTGGGTTFTCTGSGPVVCTAPSLPYGSSAVFEFTYITGAGGSTLVNTSSVESTTLELNTEDNNSIAPVIRVGGGDPADACVLSCPNNMIVSANTTQGGNPGALVTFGADQSGNCGSLTSTPASGSFFSVGTTTVTTSSATGGGVCSFTVTVIETAPPTITCAADQTVAAGAGEIETSVTLNTPSSTGNNPVVTGVRSDNRGLGDPYPVGTTIITWTVTDADLRTASCQQRIIVTSPNAPTISCPAPQTYTVTGCATDSNVDVGSPTATGSGVQVAATRNDFLPLTDPYPAGQTTITWTATDDIGRVASCTQLITVNTTGSDTIAPTLNVPANVSVSTTSCSATLDDELGVATGDDNCSAVTISRSGIPLIPCPSNPSGCESFVFPAGTTTITYTATDAAGNVTTGTQLVTVTEPTPPTITAPDDAAYQCASEVPAANASQATAADNCAAPTVAVSESSNNGAGSPASPLILTRTFTATDASGNTASDSQIITVIDNTAPTNLSVPAPTTVSADNSCQAAIPDVVSGSSASDNCAGAVALTQSPAAGTLVTLGTHTITVTATDVAGNFTTASTSLTVNDTTAPVLTCPANIVVYLPANSTDVSMPVSFPNPTATDNCTAPTIGTSVASGSVFPVGTTTVNVTATDAALNQSSCSFTVTVLYNFTGFFSPVDNLPTLNTVNAGKAIPVKFSLSGNKGLSIFAANSPYSVVINCDGSAPQAEIEETLTAGSSSLTYESSSDQYHYVWKTQNSWAGTCRQLVLKLNDGSEHTALFKFR